jgi:hypothetical protein
MPSQPVLASSKINPHSPVGLEKTNVQLMHFVFHVLDTNSTRVNWFLISRAGITGTALY